MGAVETLAKHSPLGASGAERWMVCPGSVSLSFGVDDPESEHATLGTAAHALAADLLTHGGDAWRWVGLPAFETPAWAVEAPLVDKDMADAVQFYLDSVRVWHPERNQGNSFIEKRFHCPSIHRLMYGTSDFGYIAFRERTLHVWDYKHGAGIVVDVIDNPQLKYYAGGVLEYLDLWARIDKVTLHICQPRGWHSDGQHRHWSLSVDVLLEWLRDELVPAMDRALVSRDTKSGEHCRFCPARRHACPQLMEDLDELEGLLKMATTKGAEHLTNEQVARIFKLEKTYKIQLKAARETAYARLQAGHTGFGLKLVPARANRVWKEGAEKALVDKFGDDAYEAPKLRSPAAVDELPEGEQFTKRYAFKPDAGLQVADEDDNRREVSRDTKSMFQAATAARKKGKS